VFTRLGQFTVRRRRLVLALTVLFVVAAGMVGTGVFGSLAGGGFDDPGSESSQASAYLSDELGATDPELVLLVNATDGDVDDPATAATGAELTAAVAQEAQVASVVSYWSAGQPPALRGNDGGSALVVVDLEGDDESIDDAAAELEETYSGARGPVDVRVGGESIVGDAFGEQIQGDLKRAESMAIPITLVLLVLVFGGVVAASLPLAVAIVSVMGTFLALLGIAQVTDVSIYSINLTTALGLGLAIDYSLFIVSRFREELAAGHPSHVAVVRTVETAGRTVAFSALIVAASLSALLVFPLYFLRSFAYAGAAVVVIAAAGSLLSLPAVLAMLGPKVNAWSLRRRRRIPADEGFWHRLASAVMRRPIPVATGAIALLLVLGTPFLRVNPGLPSYEALPESNEARQVATALATEFAGNQAEQFAIVLPDVAADGADDIEMADFADDVRALEGVADVTVHSAAAGSWLTVVPDVTLRSADGEALVKDIRDLDAPFEFAVEGAAAGLVDTKAAIYDRLPLALAIIGVVTFVLLFAAFGSILVPVKAIVLNLLSLTATFGAMVWVFQEGNLSGLLDFTATGQLDVAMPILMFCIAFGLSMDYEVFLLSRIKEEYDRSGDNTRAVALGLERTGRIVTAAAAVLAVTFVAFGASGVSFLKMFGVGLALAVVMDATIIRGLLVPAFMRLAGEANWWAPRPLRRLQERYGLHEAASIEAVARRTRRVDDTPRRAAQLPRSQAPRSVGETTDRGVAVDSDVDSDAALHR
jgi:RND superfamily putative drug exporter